MCSGRFTFELAFQFVKRCFKEWRSRRGLVCQPAAHFGFLWGLCLHLEFNDHPQISLFIGLTPAVLMGGKETLLILTRKQESHPYLVSYIKSSYFENEEL